MSTPLSGRPWYDSWRGLGLLTIFAFELRYFHLAFRSIWLDEAYSVKLATSSFANILHGASMDIHPPLYHLVLAGWIRMFGTTELGLRSLSAVLGALLVPVAYHLTKSLAGRRAAWWTAVAVTLSPYFIELSRSARMGSMLALFAGLSLYFFWKFFQEGRMLHAAGFVLSMLAAMYTHYFGFLVFFAVHLFMFMGIGKLEKPRWWRIRWMFLQLHILAGFAPWMPSLWDHLHKGGPAWRGVGVSWSEPLHAFYSVAVGTACWSLMDKALVLTALGLMAGLLLFKLAPRLEAVYESLPSPNWGFIITVMLVPIGIVLAYSWNRLNVFDNRYLSMVGLMLLVLLGIALSQVPWRSAFMAVPLLLVGFAVPLGNQYFVYGYFDNWRAVAQRLEQQGRPQDRVAVYPAWNEAPLEYYIHDRMSLQGLPGTYDPVSGDTQNYFPIDPANVDHLQSIFNSDRRVWLVMVNEGEEQELIKSWFARRYRPGPVVKIGGIWVGLYEK
jgi:uncharacterized membrane protein